MIRRLQISLADGEDAHALARDAASAAIEIAENDADGARKRYHIAVLGAAPIDKRAPVLTTVSIVVSGDGDDDDAGNSSTTRAAGKLMSDMGDRFLRMQDTTVNMIERLHPLAMQTEQASAERVRATGDTAIATLKLQIAERERKENIAMLLELAPIVMPFVKSISDAIVEAIKAKGRDK